MDTLKTVMFIDGRNFKYNLREFRFQSPKQGDDRSYSLDEKHFLWDKFFMGIIRKFDECTHYKHQMVRVYWYNADRIRPFHVDDRRVQSILTEYSERLPELNKAKLIELAKAWHLKEKDNFHLFRDEICERIQRATNFLEFKCTGEYIVHPFRVYRLGKNVDGKLFYEGTIKGEKGVDVGIAVDMIAKMSNYDAAILISGDADFLPVVKHLKDSLKIVYQFSNAKGVPPRIQYLSPWLRGIVDVFQWYDEVELLETYIDKESRIPASIMQVIKQRVKDLKALASAS